MRIVLAGLTLLAVAVLPCAAAADTVDNFTLSGNGNVYTWSLPATETYPYQLHLGYLTFLDTVTVNGTTQINGDIGFYTNAGLPGLDLSVPGISDALDGPLIATTGPVSAGYVTVSFATGIFNLTDEHFGPGITNPLPPTRYTLTVVESDTATTPEPSSLLLLATTMFGAAIVFGRRRAV